jgi:uncharacterized membrane protein YkvA (DUF1232 family)
MADLRITFTLSDKDVAHLRRIMRRAAAAAREKDEATIVRSALRMAGSVRAAKPPEYVLQRVDKLETIVELAQDKDWQLPAPVRRKVLAALTYFCNPTDLIPDAVPGLGFLDDAVMIELVAQELKHETRAYQEFVRFRKSAEQRPWTTAGKASLESRLVNKRKQLRARVDKQQAEGPGGLRSLFKW